ncbi:MAG: hypothetical protein GY786_08575 [Proteobacteria bacterium]|nr:hypothetical protein [Pseudomonadota bacterium]
MKRWEEFKKKQPIKEVKKCSKKKEKLGAEEGIKIVKEYGEQLLIHIENFDISNIRDKLAEFPELVERLKLYDY